MAMAMTMAMIFHQSHTGPEYKNGFCLIVRVNSALVLFYFLFIFHDFCFALQFSQPTRAQVDREHTFHRLLFRLFDSPLVFCVDVVVVDVVAAVVAAFVAAASALFGRFRRIFNTCPRVQFPARFAPLLTC